MGAPLNLSVSSRRTHYPDDHYHFDNIDDDEILSALLASPVRGAEVGVLFHVLLGDERSGAYTDLIVRKGVRPLAEFIPSHMGWVSRDQRSIDVAIEEKAKRLPNYRQAAGDDVRLLVVADWTRNSGKADIDSTAQFDLRGFNAVYFSTGVKAFKLNAH